MTIARTDPDLAATWRREVKAMRSTINDLMSENARLRTDIVSLLDWDEDDKAMLRDLIYLVNYLTLLADPMPSQRWDSVGSSANQPLPHEPTERARFGKALLRWRVMNAIESCVAHHPIQYEVHHFTPAGPRPKPPPRRDDEDA